MDALLIVNPHATATTERRKELLASALRGATTLRTEYTAGRDHAAALAAEAVTAGTRLIVVHGGDGTVNEAVNGMLATSLATPRAGGAAPVIPLLAILPGGSTNVFARALGIDPDPIAAIEQILDGLARGRTRTVSVGRVDIADLTEPDAAEGTPPHPLRRLFTFNAGLGLDAEVVRRVEEHRASGRRISNALHIRRAIRAFYASDRRTPPLAVAVDGGDEERFFLALVSNVSPWTYAGSRPVLTNPTLPADRDLGLLALRSVRTTTTLRILRQLLWRSKGPRSRAALRVDRAGTITVRGDGPLPLQVDGDHIGAASAVTFTSIPQALRVIV